MKTLEIDYTMDLEFSVPVTDHYFLLRCVPISKGGQVVVCRNLEINPAVNFTSSTDVFENRSYQGRIDEPHTFFSYHSSAKVQVTGHYGIHGFCAPLFKYPTELTRCSDSMRDFLYETFRESELLESIKSRKIKNNQIKDFAQILMTAVHNKIEYTPGVTNVNTSAAQAFDLGKGVCQDYSHIFCSLCREAGIPSRYVAGSSVGEGSTHAWSDFFVPDETYISSEGKKISGRWFGVDCTRNKTADDNYVVLASGRDYSDCKVDVGIFRGAADQKMTVFIKTTEIKTENKKNETNLFVENKNKFEEKIEMLKMKNQQQQM